MTKKPPRGRPDTAPADGGFWVGGWWVEPNADRLRQGERLVRVEPKVMDVLVYLASRAGDVVSRQDLERDVWRGALVGYDAVTKTVIKLRQALGGEARDRGYIETIPKRGYRLVAEVVVGAQAGGSVSAVEEPIPSPSHPERRRFWAVVLPATAIAALLLYLVALVPDKAPDATDRSPASTAVTPAGQTRVVVLPFEVLGQVPDQLYLARGLTADLIGALSSFSGLLVTAGPISGGAENGEGPIADGAGYEVWGGVKRTGDRIQAEVRLTQASSGRQLAIERYDRPFADLFEMQDDISNRLAMALSATLTKAEQRRVARRFTRSVTAYDLFLQGQSLLLVRRAPENVEARSLYLRAISEDPTFARAYAGLALTYAAEYRNQWASDGAASLARAQRIAETAAEIDPTLPEVHWALGYVKAQQRRHQEAVQHLDRALVLDPRFADALALKGGIKTYAGAPAETIPLVRQAMRLNPTAGYLYFMILGRAYFFLDDQPQAVINLREATLRNPEILEAHVFLAAALERGGKHDEAAWEADEVRAIQPDFSTRTWLDTYPMTDREQARELIAALARLGL